MEAALAERNAERNVKERNRAKEIALSRLKVNNHVLPVYSGEFWTARQRQMHPIHYTVSYRASFKPELPDYFIQKYCRDSDAVVLDPFGGRGTTAIQANLLGFRAVHNDANPVSFFLASARREVPDLDVLIERTMKINTDAVRRISKADRARLSPFFHTDTLNEILNLKALLLSKKGQNDPAVRYIGLTALSRLYGHSDGFFSVYTFPQISIMPGAQERNNRIRGQKPEYKNIKDRIIRKMKRDLSQSLPACYHPAASNNVYTGHDARDMASIPSSSVNLVVTSPPFLNKVNYLDDNWMRAWFLGLERQVDDVEITMTADVKEWGHFMRDVMLEIGRVLKPGGRAVIEVGEVVCGGHTAFLEEILLSYLPMEVPGGRLRGDELYINSQSFTKLANCWDVTNNKLGTNTNRCLVILKDAAGRR